MSTSRFLYYLVVSALRGVAPVLGSGSSKLARGFRGRRVAHVTLEEWGLERRDPIRPTVWVHAPSVGEGYQARSVIEALKSLRPDVQVVFTHFSPSAVDLAATMPVDVSAYLPWDLRPTTGPVLDAIAPDLLVFTKTEVWPVLAEEAARRSIPVCLIAATVPERSGRLRGPARSFLRATWSSLASACAVGEADAVRLRSLGVPEGRVLVTGDPGIDSAAQRAQAAAAAADFLAPFHAVPRPTLVAGSTWPSDDEVLLPALRAIAEERPDVRIIIAPHEPTSAHVAALVGRFEAAGRTARTLTQVEARGAEGVDVVVVDRVGVLAHLYSVATFAYVGGGFHTSGLHSVLEPAAVAVPVMFGPDHQNAPAAAGLMECGGGYTVRDAEEVAQRVLMWAATEDDRVYASARALSYIDAHRGAAERTAHTLFDIMTSRLEWTKQPFPKFPPRS
jgi:3-deoxy-D-manno-octulosonic-acid transferase